MSTEFAKTPAMLDGEALVQYLQTRDVPCPGCGYNLRQLQSVMCPECGQQLKLSVGLVDQRLGWWITCLLGCCIPATFGAFTLIFVAPDVPTRELARIPWQILLLWTYLIAMIPTVFILIVRRRTYQRMPHDRQIVLGAAPWFVLVATVLFMMMRF
ncbi:MAG TPA: hypothetical protein VGN72_09075 [Tepidisphaeraceae bacterium]|jgi:hypothetical protein|nr:hypothetical protein [Tepidisphaeraceae bacterium]